MMVLTLTYKSQSTEMFGFMGTSQTYVLEQELGMQLHTVMYFPCRHAHGLKFVQVHCNVNSKGGKHWVLLFALPFVALRGQHSAKQAVEVNIC